MKNKLNNELAVCGFAAVKELEKNTPQIIQRLYFSADKAPLFGGLCRKMAKEKRIYNQVEPQELEKLSGSVHHQGVVAMIPYPEIPRLSSAAVQQWIDNKEHAVLLDRIGNANNLGAIIRSAAFFSIKNIIIPLEESQTGITTSTYRVAQGGMEYVNIYTIQSPDRFLTDIKDKMVRIGTAVAAKTTSTEIKSVCSGKSALIVLGNEETGISEEVQKNCDVLITIPAPVKTVDSLNVAQAASIIFYELSK